MGSVVQTIPLLNLSIVFIPVLVVLGVYLKWALDAGNALYAFTRMLVQLLLIGYVLSYIFETQYWWGILLVLAVMLFSSAWIALGSVKTSRLYLYKNALISIATGGLSTLFLVTMGVLDLEPWFLPRYTIPLAGMIFANSMNSVSLSAERMVAELNRKVPFEKARKVAFQASLIPLTNSLFAVGLVSLPGMMTGQILSGISPQIAARYQIMVMCMVFGASGISAALFLSMSGFHFKNFKSETK